MPTPSPYAAKCVDGCKVSGYVMGVIVCGDSISASVDALMSCWPPIFPSASKKRSHWLMSSTLELIEPAGAMLSMLRQGTGTGLPSRQTCGVATSGEDRRSFVLVLLDVIPNGAKIRCL